MPRFSDTEELSLLDEFLRQNFEGSRNIDAKMGFGTALSARTVIKVLQERVNALQDGLDDMSKATGVDYKITHQHPDKKLARKLGNERSHRMLEVTGCDNLTDAVDSLLSREKRIEG